MSQVLVRLQSSFVKMVKKNFTKWSEDIKSYVNPVKKAVNTQVYYDFNNAQTIEALKILAKKLKEASLDE